MTFFLNKRCSLIRPQNLVLQHLIRILKTLLYYPIADKLQTKILFVLHLVSLLLNSTSDEDMVLSLVGPL